MAKFRIGLIFSDTGGGHRSATDAVECAIREIAASEYRDNEIEIITDNVVEKTHPINRAFVDFYNYLLRHNQRLMKYYYAFIHTVKPNDTKFGYAISGPWLEQWLLRVKPDMVVSVHPMCNQYIMKAMKVVGVFGTTKLVTVVTDPGGDFWKGWAVPEADCTVVPNDLCKKRLVDWGVPAARIKTLGMPVHPDFIKPPSVPTKEFRQHLGLQPDKLTVCINAGWAGGGNMLAIYRELSKVNRPIQAIFLCGHNRNLYEKARREARNSSVPTAVLPFHDKMSDLMYSVDLMVTKAGGLTTFEAIARHLPMAIDMITEPMPQEAGNVDILLEQKLASAIRTPEDIVEVVERLHPPADRSSVKLPAVHNLDQTGAVLDIARTVLRLLPTAARPIGDEVKVERP